MSITDENIRKITKFAMLKFIADWKTEKNNEGRHVKN